MRLSGFTFLLFGTLFLVSAGCSNDGGSPDGGTADSGMDGGSSDAMIADGLTTSDGSASDVASADGRAVDGGVRDSGSQDGVSQDGGSPPSDCNFGGWCWVFPDPFAVRVTAVWGAAADDVWAVGPRGFIAHFNGAEWSVEASPVTETDLRAIHGSDADNISAVGDDGLALHWDGTSWRQIDTVGELDLADVFMASDGDGWAVGEDRSLLRFNGTAWTLYRDEPTFGPYTTVWGSGPNDVWVGSTGDGFDHWDGDNWTYDEGPPLFHRGTADIWGTGPDDVWASSRAVDIRISHWNGSEWTNLDLPSPVVAAAVHGRAADDVWFVGYSGGAIRWDGTEFRTVDLMVQEEARDIILFPGDGWIVGSMGRMFRNDGSETWTLGAGSGQGNQNIGRLAPAAGGGIYAQATDGVWHYEGSARTRVTEMPMSAMHELPSGELWLVLGNDVYRWDGTNLESMPLGDFGSLGIQDLWGTGPEDMYFAMNRESVLHWDGTDLEFVYGSGSFSDLGQVTHIEGTGVGDVWAITDNGSILRGDAGSLSEVAVDGDVWWTSLRAFASNDVWVGGGGATLWHWDGTSWDVSDVPDIQRSFNRGNSPYVVAITGTGGSEVSAITDLGHVLRLELGEWVRERTLPMRLNSITTDAAGMHWASGQNNLVRHAAW